MGKKVFSFLKLAPLVSAATALIISLSGCGGLSSALSGGVTISGRASLAPVDGGTVKVACIEADGSVSSDPLGSTVTDSEGDFEIKLDEKPSCAVQASITGGSYFEEAGGLLVSLVGKEIRVVVSSFDEDKETLALTPLTEVSAQRFFELAVQFDGVMDASQWGDKAEAANALVSAAAGFPVGMDIGRTRPADSLHPDANPNSYANMYALFNAAISEAAYQRNLLDGGNRSSFEMVSGPGSFGDDFKDGSFGALSGWSGMDDHMIAWQGSGRNEGNFVMPTNGMMGPPTSNPEVVAAL